LQIILSIDAKANMAGLHQRLRKVFTRRKSTLGRKGPLMKAIFFSLLAIFASSAQQAQAESQISRYYLPSHIEQVSFSVGPAESDDQEYYLDIDLETRILKGDFTIWGELEGNDHRYKESCKFQKRFSANELATLKSHLSRLVYCKQRGDDDIAVDPMYTEDLTVYTEKPSRVDRDGKSLAIEKYYYGDGGIHRYLCSNYKPLYNYVRTLVEKYRSGDCPWQYEYMFHFYEN
jgi:hypothetical protein